MNFSIKYTTALLMLLLGGLFVSCSDNDDDDFSDSVKVESVTASLTPLTDASYPANADLAARYAAGHEMTLRIASYGNAAQYKLENGRWIPAEEAAAFPDNGAYWVNIAVKPKGDPRQDGTAEGLLSADILRYENDKQSPARDLSDIALTHAGALVELNFDKDYGMDDVMIGSNIIAYQVPETDKYQFIVNEDASGFTIVVNIDGQTYQKEMVASQISSDATFKSNIVYNIPIALDNVNNVLVLGNITLSDWSEGSTGSGEKVLLMLYDIPQYANQTIVVNYMDGTSENVRIDAIGQGATTLNTDRVIRSLNRPEGPEIPIGIQEGGTLTLELNENDEVLLRRREGNYIISCAAELLAMAVRGDAGGNYIQEGEIDMMEYKTGCLPVLNGSYDGQNFPIHNINVEGSGDHLGLIAGTLNGTVKNVRIMSGTVTMVAENYLEDEAPCGSIVGGVYGGSLTDSYNGAKVVSKKATIGGIAGYSNGGKILNCVNAGDVIGWKYVGGIVGRIRSSSIIERNENKGYVEAILNNGGYCGGIVGNTQTSGSILYNVNRGRIYANARVGGIVGLLDGSPVLVKGNLNEGEIEGTASSTYAGGIVGYQSRSTLIGNKNTGTIKAPSNLGGIAGYIYYSSSAAATEQPYVEANYNTGNIITTSNDYCGGITGRMTSQGIQKVNACYSVGIITGSGNRVGGAIGTTSGIQLTNSYWANHPTMGNGITSPSTVYLFSATDWPQDDASKGWGIVKEDTQVGENGYYWKSLGKYDSVNPVYPKLWWEN